VVVRQNASPIQKLEAVLRNHKVVVDSLNGGTNLAYKARLVRDSLCACHCFVDNDDAGRKGFQTAKDLGLLGVGDINFASCPGMLESELEDLYAPAFYSEMILNAYKVSLGNSKFKTNVAKWSTRIAAVFKAAGKPWDDSIKAEIKLRVVRLVESRPMEALHPERSSEFSGLIDGLSARIGELPDASS
jgi:putative ATP-dependent endonuclease of OLD family